MVHRNPPFDFTYLAVEVAQFFGRIDGTRLEIVSSRGERSVDE